MQSKNIMTSPIPFDHFIFTACSDLTNACQSFFNKTGINYFQHFRIYDDGSVSGMFTNADTTRRFIELDFPSFSSFKESDKNKHDYWFMWDEELPWLPVQIGRDNGLYHGITKIRRGAGYYDMIGFAMPEERCSAASYYLSNLSSLEEFIISFEKDNSELMKNSANARIMMPEINRDANYKELCLDPNGKFKVGNSYVTSREYECLRQRDEGKSAKEIARNLSISHRSVETFFARVRERTNRYDLSEIYRDVILS